MWPELLSQETGYYSLEYAPTNNLAGKRTTQLSGAHTSFTVSNLTPETTYEVALVPESNVHYFPPQTTRVTTLAGKMSSVVTEGGRMSLRDVKPAGQPLLCTPQPPRLAGGGRRLQPGQTRARRRCLFAGTQLTLSLERCSALLRTGDKM